MTKVSEIVVVVTPMAMELDVTRDGSKVTMRCRACGVTDTWEVGPAGGFTDCHLIHENDCGFLRRLRQVEAAPSN